MNSGGELVDGYDLIIFDLDGVLYIGDQPVARAPAAVARLRDRRCAVTFATNNASRTTDAVADLLGDVGISASTQEVLTSARASATLLAKRYPKGSPILIVGAPSLAEEVFRAGLRPVTTAEDQPVAVVQGYGPDVGWRALAEAAVAVPAGALWVATNADRTLPSPRGPMPGNGAMIAALATGLDRQPDIIVGKPDPGLFHEAVALAGARRPLAVGDRLDTDIEGARRAGMDSLLVLTGVSRPVDLLFAPPERRPTYVAEDLDGLFTAQPSIGDAEVGGWRVRVDDSCLVLEGDGTAIDALRALCGCAWAERSWFAMRREGVPARRAAPIVAATGTPGKAVLARLGLT